MTSLQTKSIFPPQPAPLAVPFVKPLSYEFRVVEHVEGDKIVKTSLQMQIWEHDEFGVGTVKLSWADVPRYRFENGIMQIKI